MSNPQLENGYTRIANEIMDALAKYRIPGEQRQCLDFILRKTYGFKKKSDAISISQFHKATGLKKPNIIRALGGLLSKKIINVIKSDNKNGKVYEFNKDYSVWVKNVIKSDNKNGKVYEFNGNSKKFAVKNNNKSLSKVIPTKEIIINNYAENSNEVILSRFLFSMIKKNDPKTKKPNFQKWAKNIDYLIRLDGRSPNEIKQVITWSQKDSFWKSNILSTDKLRKQFGQLWQKMNTGKPPEKKLIPVDPWAKRKSES